MVIAGVIIVGLEVVQAVVCVGLRQMKVTSFLRSSLGGWTEALLAESVRVRVKRPGVSAAAAVVVVVVVTKFAFWSARLAGVVSMAVTVAVAGHHFCV